MEAFLLGESIKSVGVAAMLLALTHIERRRNGQKSID